MKSIAPYERVKTNIIYGYYEIFGIDICFAEPLESEGWRLA